MNIQNNRAAEVLYSTTYVEDYLDTVENLPDEVQRLLSRLTLLDAEGKTYFDKIHGYFAQLVRLKQRNKRGDNEDVAREMHRVYGHVTVTLIKSQEIGDEKIQVAQQIQDFVDNRLRQLEVDRKTLDSVQKQSDVIEPTTSSPYSVRGDGNHRLVSNDASTSERGLKRVRRVRLGPPIIPNKPTNSVPSTTAPHSLVTSTDEKRSEENSTSVRALKSETSSSTSNSASTTTALTNSEREKPKEKVKGNPQQQSASTSGSSSQDSRKDSAAVSSSSSLPTKKRMSEAEPMDLHIQPVQPEVSAERKSDHLLRTPKKKEKKMVVAQKQERKSSSAATSSAAAAKRSATKRKAQQDGAIAGADPDEATYCICVQISYGDMIGCDNDLCPIEWFHFSCVQLTAKPKGKWYCPSCRDGKANIMKPKEVFLKELEQYNREREGR